MKKKICTIISMVLLINLFSVTIPEAAEEKAAAPVFKTVNEAVPYLRQQMVNRNTQISLVVNIPYYDDMEDEIIDLARKYYPGCKSGEGDYLNFSRQRDIFEISSNWVTSGNDDDETATITYHLTYLSTAEEEKIVDTEVKKALDFLNVYNKDEYTKIKAVHDYIIFNVMYDLSYKNNTAYQALVNKKATNRAYSLLTYKMLKELGIETRIITGSSGISWNVVKLDGLWYNMDNANDNVYLAMGADCYTFFLKNRADFANLNKGITDKVYTEYFNSSNPMAEFSYAGREDINKDGKVDSKDIAEIAMLYNVQLGNSKYKSSYDFNNDNIIDIYDVAAISKAI